MKVTHSKSPVRLGLVIGQLTAGGAEKQLWLLCRGLDRAALTPLVYCLSGRTEPYGPRIEAAGVPVRVITGGRLGRMRALRRALDNDGLGIIHSWLFIANAYVWAANHEGRRPLLTSARNCKRQGWALDCLNRRAFAASAAIVANSHDVATYIARHYQAPKDRTRVIYNGIDTSRFCPSCTAGTEVVGPIVTVGRLVDQKNHHLFLQAAAQLVREVADARFVIVGDGPLRSALEAQARALGLEGRVTFTGARDDVDAILQAASLFWLTSRWEGMPNAVLEAMACGVPVIATGVGGVSELLRPGIEGFIVANGEPRGFVEHSRSLLCDAGLWQRFRAAARARAEEFSAARMAHAYAQLYEELLARGE